MKERVKSRLLNQLFKVLKNWKLRIFRRYSGVCKAQTNKLTVKQMYSCSRQTKIKHRTDGIKEEFGKLYNKTTENTEKTPKKYLINVI